MLKFFIIISRHVKTALKTPLINLALRGLLTSWWTSNSFGHFRHIHDDSFDTVTLSFYLSDDSRHFVAIEGIADGSVHV